MHTDVEDGLEHTLFREDSLSVIRFGLMLEKNGDSIGALNFISLITVVLIVCSCAQLPTNYPVEKTALITDTEHTALGRRSAADRRSHPGKSQLIPLIDGVDAFYARAALAIAAERSLDVQYFLWHKDVTGQLLLKVLLDAADRGVRVRLLLDDLDNQALDPEFYALDTHPNFSIRLFNPFVTRGFKYIDFFTSPARLNRRMHNKSFTADNQYAILGGRNIGDKYFDALEDVNFYDMDVIVTGPVVGKVSTHFDKYWNHETAVPIYAFEHNTATADDLEDTRSSLMEFAESQRKSRYADDVRAANFIDAVRGGRIPTYYGDADVVYDDPDKGLVNPPYEFITKRDLLNPYLKSLQNRLILVSPYFVPRTGGVKSMGEMVDDGTSIDVITNSYSSTDSGLVHAGYSRYRSDLLASGIQIFELKPSSRKERPEGSVAFDSEASLHTKVFIFDRETVYIGSLNLDPRSVDINTEVGVMFHSPEMASRWANEIDENALEHVYELELVQSPAESRGEFTYYTWDIEWLERIDGKTVRHEKEPGIGFWNRILLFLKGLVPEGQI